MKFNHDAALAAVAIMGGIGLLGLALMAAIKEPRVGIPLLVFFILFGVVPTLAGLFWKEKP